MKQLTLHRAEADTVEFALLQELERVETRIKALKSIYGDQAERRRLKRIIRQLQEGK